MMLRRVLWGERKALAIVGNRLLCAPTTALISKSNCANQVWPSYRFLSTKTPPLSLDVKVCSRSEKLGLEEAMGLFNSFILKEPRPPVSEFDKLLEAILSSHQYSFKSRSIAVIALSKVMTSLEIQPSLVTLTMLLDCYCSGVGRLDLGFSVLSTIQKIYPDGDGAIYATLLTGLIVQDYCKKLQQGKAGRKRIVASLTDNIKDGDDNRVSFSRLIGRECSKFKDQLLSHKLEFCPYTCLLRSLLISSQSKEKVTSLFKYLIALENFPDSPSVYIALNDALCQQGMMTEAHALLQHLVLQKKLDPAQNLLERMIKDGHTPAPSSYQLLIDEFHKQGRPEKANTISSMLKLATDAEPQISVTIGVDGVVDDTDVYCFILDGMCKDGKLSEALQLFRSLPTAGVEHNVRMYNSVISGLSKKEDMFDQAVLLLHDMEKKGFKLDRSLFTTLLKGYVSHYTEITKLMDRLSLMQQFNFKFALDAEIRSFLKMELRHPSDELLRKRFW